MTNTPFQRSAAIYDTVHAGKDYAAETAFIWKYLRESMFRSRIIDWGCGTGEFTKEFAKLGFDVIGVDPSDEMIQVAKRKGVKAYLGSTYAPPPEIRGEHENATCLFGAFSYIAADAPFRQEEARLKQALQTIRGHLIRGGRFVFDVINYGAASSNLREYTEDNFGDVHRWMKKTFDPHNGIVSHEIKYTYQGQAWMENHRMKAFTVPEISYALRDCGFSVQLVCQNQWDEDVAVLPRVHLSDYYFTVVAEAN